jgi:hypothetical protein
MYTFDINYLAILVSGIIAVVIGAVWYTAFSEPWIKLNGFTKKQIEERQDTKGYAIAFISALFMGFVMANIVLMFEVREWNSAIVAAFFTWIGLNLMSLITIYRFSMRPLKLAVLDAGKELSVMIAMAVLFTYWG